MPVKIQFYLPIVQYAATDTKMPSFRPYHSRGQSILPVLLKVFFNPMLPLESGELLLGRLLQTAATCRLLDEYGAMLEWYWRENWSTGRKTLYSVDGRWMDEYGAMVEWYWQEKNLLVSLCPPQIPSLAWGSISILHAGRSATARISGSAAWQSGQMLPKNIQNSISLLTANSAHPGTKLCLSFT
jgi:hypothetical protein